MYSERGNGAGGTGSGSGSGPSGGVDSGGGGAAGVRSRGARRDLSENVNRDAESEIMDLFHPESFIIPESYFQLAAIYRKVDSNISTPARWPTTVCPKTLRYNICSNLKTGKIDLLIASESERSDCVRLKKEPPRLFKERR